MLKFCHIITVFAILLVSGCAAGSTAGQIAGGVASGGGSFLASHIGGVNVSYDATTGVYTGGLVFKDGRWQRGAGPVTFARSAGDCVEETRAISRDVCPEDVRSLRSAVNGATYTLALPVDQYGLRAIVDSGRGVRGLTGPLVSSRSISRAVAVSARAMRDEENETFEALKELHDAEDKRLRLVIRATNPSMFGSVNRFFRGTPCIEPTAPLAPVIDNYQPTFTAPVFQPSASLPDPANDVAAQTPNGIMKSVGSLESRIVALEQNQKSDHLRIEGMDNKLDAILAIVKTVKEKQP